MKRALATAKALALASALACTAPAPAPYAADAPGAPVLASQVLASPTAALAPQLGRHATPAEIAALDIDIAPDGAGLPPGNGTAAEGAAIYAARCAHCHGAAGEGGLADPLVGGVGSLTSAKPLLTVGSFWPYATTLFDYLRRAMPYDAPGSLSADDLYALTAHLLERNGVIPAETRLGAASLPAIRMPNRDGFESGDASDTASPPAKP